MAKIYVKHRAFAYGLVLVLAFLSALGFPCDAFSEVCDFASQVSYVYIENSEIAEGGSQNIAVGYSTVQDNPPTALEIEDGEGHIFSIALSASVDNDYLFIASGLKSEEYLLSAIVLSSGETVSLTETGLEATFSVGACGEAQSANIDEYGAGIVSTYTGSDGNAGASIQEALGLSSSLSTSKSKGITVVLDPGHGGWDSGAVNNNGLVESNLTLKIALYCREELEKYNDVTVVMLRDSDTALTNEGSSKEELQKRCDVANEYGADFYISFHINDGGGAGAEVWIPNDSSWYQSFNQIGIDVGNDILNRLEALGLSNRGLKSGTHNVYPDGSQGDYLAVIRHCREYGIPAVLVEHGFIDNSSDASKLSNDSFLNNLGVADARAIADYFGLTMEKKPSPEVSDMDNGSITLSWDSVPDCSQYAIALCNEDGTFKTYTYDCKDTSYTVNGLENGLTYKFLVQAKVNGKWTSFTERDYLICTLVPAPRFTAAAAGDGEVLLSWGAVDGADAYAVAERLSDGSYRTFTYSAAGTSYTASDLTCGVEHKFLVQARVGGRWSSYGEGSLVGCVPAGPTKPSAKAEAGNGSVALSWGRVPGAERYAVAWRLAGTSSWNTSTYSCSGESYVVTGLSNGRSYEFLVQSRADGAWSPFGSADVVACSPVDPTAPRFTAAAAGDGEVLLSWGAVDGADAYAVAERLSDGSYRTFTYSAAGTSYTASDLTCGVEHKFLVQARVGGRWSSYGEGSLVGCVPAGPTKPSAKAEAGNGSVALSWGRVPGAERYAVAWRLAGTSSWNTSTYSCSGESYVVTGLSNGRSYEFLVQSRADGAWSPFGSADVVKATIPGTLIMGQTSVSVAKMVNLYNSSGAVFPAAVYSSKGASTIEQFCELLYEEAGTEGVRADVLFAQSMLETGWLKFGGAVRAEQCNFGGIGALDGGASGSTFADVRTGLRAQAQHLKAYASAEGLNQECVDPRFKYVSRGCAPYVEDLSGRWASDVNYGSSIVAIINKLL